MTSANLDLVRSIYADWERGDFDRADWADPDIEYVRAERPEAGTWTGLAGMAEGARTYLDAWDELRFVAREYRELDDERVLVFDDRSGRGRTSGLELAQVRTQSAHVFQVRGGKVTKLIIYLDRDRALADLGLEDGGARGPWPCALDLRGLGTQ
jgi:ketosteroid isomerase-like protein